MRRTIKTDLRMDAFDKWKAELELSTAIEVAHIEDRRAQSLPQGMRCITVTASGTSLSSERFRPQLVTLWRVIGAAGSAQSLPADIESSPIQSLDGEWPASLDRPTAGPPHSARCPKQIESSRMLGRLRSLAAACLLASARGAQSAGRVLELQARRLEA